MSETENSPIIENTVDVAVVALDQGVEHLNSLIYAAAAMAAEAKKDFATMAKEEMVEFMQKVKNDVNKEIKKANKNIEAIRGIIGDPENHEMVNHMLNTGKEQLVEVYGIAGTGAELFKERMKAEGLHLQETLTNIAVEKKEDIVKRSNVIMQKANERKEDAKKQLNKLIEDGKIAFTQEAIDARKLASDKYNKTKQLVEEEAVKAEQLLKEKGTEMTRQAMKQGKEMTDKLKKRGEQAMDELGTRAMGFLGSFTRKNEDLKPPAEGGKRKNKTRKIRNKKKMKKA